MKTTSQPTNEKVASMFGGSPERVRAQFAKNAAALRKMELKARDTGKKVNGYTAEQLSEMAAKAEGRAQA